MHGSFECNFVPFKENITLNSNCEASRLSKNLKSIVEDRVFYPKLMLNLSLFFFLFTDKIMFKSHIVK